MNLIFREKVITPGYVLHQYAYGDDSTVVKLLTQEFGCIAAIAKHSKTRRVGWNNWLRPFSCLSLQLVGRGQLFTLRSVEPLVPATHLVGHRLFGGLYVNELLLGFLPEKEPIAELMSLYQQTIESLRQGDIEPTLRSFELYLLAALGYMPTLLWDEQQQAVEPDQYYRLLPDHLPCSVVRNDADHTVFSGELLRRIADQNWQCLETLKAAKRLMRYWIMHYRQGKPLKSRELYSVPVVFREV